MQSRLLADIGGTNARFAIEQGGAIIDERVLPCADYPELALALRSYLEATGRRSAGAPVAAAIAIAAPLLGDRVAMTNHAWSFSAAALRQAMRWQRLILLNDFTAVALAVPHLQSADLEQVGGSAAEPGQARALLGPGTGLGVSGLTVAGGIQAPIQGEGGHVTLPATNERERLLLAHLWRQLPHVSAERLLSGPGIELLYRTLCEVDCVPVEALSAAQITTRGLEEKDGPCRSTLEQFCAWLGTVAGDLALTLGARGGVYIGGGIVPRLGGFFARSAFRARFEAKGRYAGYLAAIPAYVIHARHPGLLGCARSFTDPSPRHEAA